MDETPHRPHSEIETLDAEHRMQLALMESLGESVANGDVGASRERLEALSSYLRAHFMSEQLMMRLHAFPDFAAHQYEHDEAIERLCDLERRLGEGESGATLESLGGLREWLLEHVNTLDRGFTAYLAARGIGAA